MPKNELPSLSGKETLILELLLATPGSKLTPLDMLASAKGGLGRGTVYVTLARMEDKGYVESEQETPPPGWIGHPRRVYWATGYGRRVLEAWQLARTHLVGVAT